MAEKSNLIPIAYVGKKDRQDDPIAGTELVWVPGDVHHVTPHQAALLLNHPDVWADDRLPGLQKKKPIIPAVPVKPKMTEEEERALSNLAPLIDIGVLDKDGLQQFAMREFGMELDPAIDETAMREQVQARVDGQRFQ